MRCVLVSCLLLVTGCSLGGGPVVQGSGNLKTENRDAQGFTAIEIIGMGDLVVEKGDADTLSVTSDDNILPLLETKVEGGVLRLSPGRNNLRVTKLEYRVTAKDPKRFGISGSGKVDASKLDTDEVSASISGAGNITLAGSAGKLDVHISGAGRCSAENLSTKKATVGISGAGSITVNASEKLDARVSGAGSVRYLGSPELTTSVSGAGSVRKK